MSKILYAIGCSWTFGNGIQEDSIYIPGTPKINYTWPRILGDKLGYSVINESQGGGSNAMMVRKTCNFLLDYPKENFKDLIIAIGFTTVERDEIYIEEVPDWYNFNAQQIFSTNYEGSNLSKDTLKDINDYQKLYITHIYNHRVNMIKFIQQKFMLSNMLENLGIKYIFFNSLPAVWDIEHIHEYGIRRDQISKPNILEDDVFSVFCEERNLKLSSCCHPLSEAHRLWADFLFARLTSLYGDKI